MEKSGVVDRILAYAKFKEKQDLQKKGGTRKKKLTGIAKLDDANFAGGAKGKDCTLILTEGGKFQNNIEIACTIVFIVIRA